MTRTLIICSLVLATTALYAAEGETKGPKAEGMKRPMPPLVTALDKNGDRTIDAAEITGAPDALKTLDKNSDGKVTGDELRPPRPEGAGDGEGKGKGKGERRGRHGKPSAEGDAAVPPPPGEGAPAVEGRAGQPGRPHMPMPLVNALDKNSDRVLDETEIAGAAASLKTLDKNGDGTLTADEIRPPRPEGAEGRGKGPKRGEPCPAEAKKDK